MGVFQFDSSFMRIMDKISRYVLLNILLLFTCIPVITAGAGFSAVYYSFMRWIEVKDDRVLHNFFAGLRQGWRPATLGWLGLMGITVFYILDFKLLMHMPSPWKYVIGCVAGFTAVCVLITAFYYFAVAAKVQARVSKLLVISFSGGMRCLVHTLALAMLWAIEIFAFTFSPKLIPIWVICGFSLFARIRTQIILWVFQKIKVVDKRRGE